MKPRSFVLAAALVVTAVPTATADHYPQARFQLSDGIGDKHIPNVERNWQDDEYLAVWHHTPDIGYRSIKAQRIDSNGDLVGPGLTIGDGFVDRVHPSVAYNRWDNEYLVVYMKDEDSNGEWQIWGRLLNQWGGSLGDEFLICDWLQYGMWTPRVTWNSYRNEYAVVWYGENPTGGFGVVGFIRVSATGTVIGDYLTVAFGNADQQSDIVYNLGQDEYLVVYTSFPPENPNGEIRARRVRWDGVLQGASILVTPDDPEGARFPSVATNALDLYVIAWEEYVVSDWDVLAQYHASVDGTAVTGQIWVSGSAFVDEAQPRVDVNGSKDQAVVVYETDLGGDFVGRSIEAAVIHRFHSYPEMRFDVAAVPAWSYGDPAIAWGGTDYISVYTSNSSITYQEIDGCLMGLIHVDGFESGNTAIWSDSTP